MRMTTFSWFYQVEVWGYEAVSLFSFSDCVVLAFHRPVRKSEGGSVLFNEDGDRKDGI